MKIIDFIIIMILSILIGGGFSIWYSSYTWEDQLAKIEELNVNQ